MSNGLERVLLRPASQLSQMTISRQQVGLCCATPEGRKRRVSDGFYVQPQHSAPPATTCQMVLLDTVSRLSASCKSTLDAFYRSALLV
jgi:hypothetical protein